jgi:hypothetical protein
MQYVLHTGEKKKAYMLLVGKAEGPNFRYTLNRRRCKLVGWLIGKWVQGLSTPMHLGLL